ncbi:hypothetical protein Lal_00045715, partial [Lupinus albus]
AEEKKHGGSCRNFQPKEGATRGSRCCELCGLKASLYCQADDTYLCRKNEANFLALRHIRCFLCNTYQNLISLCNTIFWPSTPLITRRYLIGTSLEVILPLNIPNNCNNDIKCSRLYNITYQCSSMMGLFFSWLIDRQLSENYVMYTSVELLKMGKAKI